MDEEATEEKTKTNEQFEDRERCAATQSDTQSDTQ